MNSRLDELQAALLSERLKWLPDVHRAPPRRSPGRTTQACANPHVRLLAPPQEADAHVHHLYVLRCETRDALKASPDRARRADADPLPGAGAPPGALPRACGATRRAWQHSRGPRRLTACRYPATRRCATPTWTRSSTRSNSFKALMEHFVTLFDSLFLPQGLALHASMQRHAGDYTLWVLCVDDAAHRHADPAERCPGRSSLRAHRPRDPELLHGQARARTRGEYCWTLTPFAPRFVFEADPAAQRVTYLDADLWFRQSAEAAVRASSSVRCRRADHRSRLRAEHSTSRRIVRPVLCAVHDLRPRARRAGAAVVGRALHRVVLRALRGRQVRRPEVPRRLARAFRRTEVHVLRDRGLMLAPWNATRFPYSEARRVSLSRPSACRGGARRFRGHVPAAATTAQACLRAVRR